MQIFKKKNLQKTEKIKNEYRSLAKDYENGINALTSENKKLKNKLCLTQSTITVEEKQRINNIS